MPPIVVTGGTMLDARDLRKISERTLAYYEDTADAFWEGTRDHDVSQNVHALLSYLGTGRCRILDFGCGPGRDLRAFSDLGHEAIGLDGTARFVEMFRDRTRPSPRLSCLGVCFENRT